MSRPALDYTLDRISLAKRAGHARGWQYETLTLYGRPTPVCFKTFLATYKPAGGRIRVVIVRAAKGDWRGYFCTDADATVADILGAVADRSAIEQNYHDVKEVHGAGEQQLRNYWANLAAWHLTMWLHTLIELWAWHQPHEDVVDRSASPWDDAARRPSHADRRNALRRRCLQDEYQHTAAADGFGARTRRLWERLLRWAA